MNIHQETKTILETSEEFLTDFDLHLFQEGTHVRVQEKLGAHRANNGTHFAVWAPNAQRVFVLGEFDDWNTGAHPLSQRGVSGVWEGFVPGAQSGARYKYRVVSRDQSHDEQKPDPFAFAQEPIPGGASVVCDLDFDWSDEAWMAARAERQGLRAPVSIYEVHLASWMRVPEEGARPLTYRELAPRLAEYALNMGFTHVQFLPVAGSRQNHEHGEWRRPTLFAPDSRFGSPQDLMFLVNELHRRGLGVIFDWVPLAFRPGTGPVDFFEVETQPTANSGSTGPDVDVSCGELRSLLLSSAGFWLETYHVDGLRVHGLDRMLGGQESESHSAGNDTGHTQSKAGVEFIQHFNSEIYHRYPHVQTIAACRNRSPLASQPVWAGGLGFGFTSDSNWTSDLLDFFAHDYFARRFHLGKLIAKAQAAFRENYLLPLGLEQAGHSERSLLARMAGDEWQRFANLRLLLSYLYLWPGKKLLFMGAEFAQWQPWQDDRSLDWHLAAYAAHAGMQHWFQTLNLTYRHESALHESDTTSAGFEWALPVETAQDTLAWFRWDAQRRKVLLVALNFTPEVHRNVRLGVPRGGEWRELLNSDGRENGGSGQGNFGSVAASPFSRHGRPHTLTITLPPLAAVVFKPRV